MFRIAIEKIVFEENGRRIIVSVRSEHFTKVSELIKWCRRREGEEDNDQSQRRWSEKYWNEEFWEELSRTEEEEKTKEELPLMTLKKRPRQCEDSHPTKLEFSDTRSIVLRLSHRLVETFVNRSIWLSRLSSLFGAESYWQTRLRDQRGSKELEKEERRRQREELLLVAFYSGICSLWVNLYLVGSADTVGTKPYNSGALEFRATYVSLLLFQGSYIWIKFRDVANKSREGYVLRRNKRSSSGNEYSKYEPRYTPPGERNWLPLCSYDTERDAEVVLQIAKFYYDEAKRVVDLGEGSQFYIPSISESERNLSAHSKWEWVRKKTREVLKEYQKEKAANSTDDLPDIQDILEGRTSVEDGTNLHQPNLRHGLLEAEQPQPPPHIQQPLEGQYFESLLENLDLFEKNKRLKSRFDQVRQLLGVPTLQPPLRTDDEESMTQHSLEEQNSELLLENQRLESILENTRSTMESTMGDHYRNSSYLVSDGKKCW